MITENELLEELAREFLPEVEENDITAAKFAARVNIGENAAKRYLDGKVRSGELIETKKRKHDGRKVSVYVKCK